MSKIKLIGFYDENIDHFELSNFGGKGHYTNKYGDYGRYSEVTYQASKLWYIDDPRLHEQLRQSYFKEVKTPKDAYEFNRCSLLLLNNRSVNDMLNETTWHTVGDSGVATKDVEMAYCLLSKFDSQTSPRLFNKLLGLVKDKNSVLVEMNPHDSYWGYANDQPHAPGKNRLGLLLTALALKLHEMNAEPSITRKIKIMLNQYRVLIRRWG
jgi:predicted NAD-dependent protein-ADP-ribosyltransferase YbiA (DUF1768 family)